MRVFYLIPVVLLLSGCICCGGEGGLLPFGRGDVSVGLEKNREATGFEFGEEGQVLEKNTEDTLVHGISPPFETTLGVKHPMPSTTILADDILDLKEVIQSGDPYFCTFNDQRRPGETWDYMMWSSGWKYMLVIGMVDGMELNIIYDQNSQYVWYKGSGEGTRYPVAGIKGNAGGVDNEFKSNGMGVAYLNTYFNPDDVKELVCIKQDISGSRFIKPSNVSFKEGKSRYEHT